MTEQNFTPGSLVSARGREWIVLPNPSSSEPNLLLLRPIDGSDEETTGILTDLEPVESAQFSRPNSDELGNERSCRYLRDALRLGVRNSAGPFRSFGHIGVDPRPYQFVPLILGLKKDPTRILIADDVGIGKTVEAALIVRELLDRGDAKRFCIVCPPYLAEQWERELYEKFGLDAKVVLPSTAGRLERECAQGESLFQVYPYTIVSIDFIKTDKRRQEFLQTAPEIVVFDEAHAVACDTGTTSRHQRYSLARDLCADPERHVILITATPHSGKENAFRSLLGLLNPDFLDENKYPSDLSGPQNEKRRMEMAEYFVQRRRSDIKDFLDEKTDFPECQEKETAWLLSREYKKIFEEALDFAKGLIEDKSGGKQSQRIRWWSALSLLRALSSSPAAAKATLLQRSQLAPEEDGDIDALSLEALEQRGEKFVLDSDAAEADSPNDVPLGVDSDPEKELTNYRRAKMREMAKEVDKLRGVENDHKLKELIKELKTLLKDGYNPIVFCRFIPTVDYLCEELRKEKFLSDAVVGVTGLLPPEDRERRVAEMAQKEKRVLVCTDCLSEGINLQDLFDATIHYDLSWNPTRHEQREGRVNRFGQVRDKVRSITFYGKDNGIDGVVLNILLKKHQSIKKQLGVSVPLPTNTTELIEALFNGLVIRGKASETAKHMKKRGPLLPEIEEYFEEIEDEQTREAAKKLHQDWDDIKTKEEKRSQTFFAHRATSRHLDEIKRELDETRRSIGSPADVEEFTLRALRDSGAVVTPGNVPHVYEFDLANVPRELKQYLPEYDEWRVSFETPAPCGAEYVSRSHPLIEGLSDYVVNTALDSTVVDPLARRCGVVRTDAVKLRHVLLLLRYRFHLIREKGSESTHTLAEDVQIVGFSGLTSSPKWLSEAEIGALLDARPSGNVNPEEAKQKLDKVLEAYNDLEPDLIRYAQARAEELKAAHTRVKNAMKSGVKTEVSAELPPDVVGVYLYTP